MIDDSVVELVINQDWLDNQEHDFNIYSVGAPVELTSQLQEHLTGYIDTDYLS